MNGFRRFGARLREFLGGPAVDRDLTDEVQSHLDHLTDEYVRRGMARDEARRAATRDFGAVEAIKEIVRDRRGFRPVERLVQDVRYAVRLLVKAPAFSIVAVATLALGIGVNTGIFSLVDAVMLRPLPYEQPGRLVSIWEGIYGTQDENNSSGAGSSDPHRTTVAAANLADYRRARSFSGLAGHDLLSANLTGEGAPERLFGESVTWNYFDVLRATPAMGRELQPADDREGAPKVVIFSDRLWRRRFNADPSIVGRAVTLDAQPYIVVGVMPPSFMGLLALGTDEIRPEFWVPAAYPAVQLQQRGDHDIEVVGRLTDGATRESAQQELTAISMDLASRFPKSNQHVRALMAPLAADLVRTAATSLWAMLAMVALILLIACLNIANLSIVRGVSRKREIAIRLALGAERGRIIRELVTQSMLLAFVGCALGVALGAWTERLLVTFAPESTPRLDQVALDGRVLAVSILLAVVTGLLFGVLPAWQASRERPVEALRSTERVVAGTSIMRWRGVLMAAEVALSAILLVGAGLTLRSLAAMNRVPLGFRTDHVLAFNVTLPEARYATADQRFRFFDALSERVGALPGVEGVAFANRLPLRGGWGSGFQISGQAPPPDGYFDCDFQAISTAYFQVLGITLQRGRLFEQGDAGGAEPVAVVSAAFSRQFIGGLDPIGRRIQRGPKAPPIRVVGVVNDVRRGGKLEPLLPQVYLPAAQTSIYPVRLADLAARTSAAPSTLVPALQRELWRLDKDQPMTNVHTLDEVLFSKGSAQRFRAVLFTLFATLALVLSLIGVYGVVAYSVSQRTPEIGVRMALGARPADIMRWLLGGTSVLVVAGAAIGLAAAFVLSKSLASLLYEVTPTDAATYASAAASLCVIALASAAMAARRAMSIDPVRALRGD